jgi:hypothetical protein
MNGEDGWPLLPIQLYFMKLNDSFTFLYACKPKRDEQKNGQNNFIKNINFLIL